MKKAMSVLAMSAVCMLLTAGARGGTSTISVSGKSGTFSIDTRSRGFKIGDVRSKVCWGEYGTKGGKKATFLRGVDAKVDFEVVPMAGDEDVEITSIVVMGYERSGRTFSMNLGQEAVGMVLKVVAKGKRQGLEVESEPFRVNVDVASQPLPFGMESCTFHYVPGRDFSVAVGNTTFQLGKDKPYKAVHPWWLPEGQTGFRPLVAMKAEFSQSHGTMTYTPGLFEMAGERKIRTRRQNGQFGKSIGVDIGFGVSGVIVMRWDPVRRAWVMDGAGLQGEVSGKTSWTWPFFVATPIGPIPMFVEAGLEAELQARLTYYGAGVIGAEKRAASWEWSAASERLPTISGALGVGVNHGFDVKGGLKGNGVFQGSIGGPDGSTFAYGVKGTLFGVIEVGPWTSSISRDTDPYWFFGEENVKGRSAKPVEVLWKPMPRNYLVGEANGNAGRKVVRAGGFATGGYPNPGPSVARGNGADWMAYLRDDGTRKDFDRPEVVVQSKTTGSWGSVSKVWDDGTADWMPSMAVSKNGSAVLAWGNAKRKWGTQTPEVLDFFKGMELAVAVRGAGTGKWTAKNLTEDEALDASPVAIAAGDGTAVVAWLRNASGALFGSALEPTSVMAARWDGSAWSTPVAVAERVGMVLGLDLDYDGTNACAVWTYDGDGNTETSGDMAVGAAVWKGGKWGGSKVLAEGLSGTTPVVARAGASPRCLWNENGVLMERAAGATGNAVAVPVFLNGWIPGDARAVHGMDGAVALAWREGDGVVPEKPVVMEYDAGMGSWGGPVAIAKAEAGRMARAVSASVGTNGVLAAWESVAATTNASGETQFGATELRAESVAATANPGVKADGFAFATNNVIAGEVTGVKVTVRNTGLKAVSNATLRVWVGDGIATDAAGRTELFGEGDKPVALDLPGGAEVEATVRWLAVDSMSNLTFVARIEPPTGTVDADAGDNEASWRPGTALLSLENARCEVVGVADRLLTATVRNTGLARAEAGTAVAFRLDSPDGRELGRDVAGSLQAGSTHGYDAGIAWNMAGETWTGTWVAVYAVIDTGNAEADASTAVPILVMTPRDRDGDGLLDGEEEAMGTDPNKKDTNGDGTNDYEHVYVYFTDPLAGMELSYTTTTPVPVPHAWLDGYADALASHAGDYEAFAWDTAANGTNRVWECYVAGTDPTDGNEAFRAVLSFQGGKPLVGPRPDLSVDGTRVYRVEGKKSAEDKDWEDVTDRHDWDGEGWRLFRMKVEMAE